VTAAQDGTELPVEQWRRLAALVRGALSHDSAAALWGIDLLAASPHHHLTVGRQRSRGAPSGTVLHRADLSAPDVTVRAGVPVTTALRTVLDLARTLPLAQAVAASDSALRSGLVRLPALVDAVAGLPRAPGRAACLAVVHRVDGRAGSSLESFGRLLLEDAGLRPFETQYEVTLLDGGVIRVDFAWPERKVVVELDGFAFHAGRQRYRSDRRRSNELALAGWTVLRFSWEDVVGRPDVVVAQVRAALGR
jgi:hypothetical protein